MGDGDESLRCRGMRDLLPEEMARYRYVEDTFARVCGQWGYSEVRTPTIEFLHLFTAAGTLSPQMLERTYSFLDWDGWSGERVVLRPDTTIPAARLYVENMSPGSIARLFYIQNVFRFSLSDESREDWQCGVELIGNVGTAGDIELILLGLSLLSELGLKDVKVGLSHAGVVREVLAAAGMDSQEQVGSYDRLLDGDLSVLAEIEARLPDLKAPLHLLFDVQGGKSAYLGNLRSAFAPTLPGVVGPLDELKTITDVLDKLDYSYHVQTTLVRNFEYYTGPVFEFGAGGRRVGSGGRYDCLVGLVGERDEAASGFALSTAEAAAQTAAKEPGWGEARWTVRPAADSADALADAFAAAAGLRERGVRVSVLPASATREGAEREVSVRREGDAISYELRQTGTRQRKTLRSLDELIDTIGEAR